MTKTLRGVQTRVLISIHIPRVGDDGERVKVLIDERISIHIPRVGDDYSHSRRNW